MAKLIWRMSVGSYTRLVTAAKIGIALAFAKQQGIGGASAPVYLDIGARGGLPRAWDVAAKLGIIRPIFVEPDPTEADRLAGAYPSATVLPCALGARSERLGLNVTKDRRKSSLLRPDYEVLSVFEGSERWAIENVVPIDVVRLDEVWKGHSKSPPHYVKIDAQGYEKQVLLGMGELLDSVLCLEFEAAFLPFYEGQPLFQEMFELLYPREFDLVKVRPLGMHRFPIMEFNAFMVRRGSHNHPMVKLWKKLNHVGERQRIAALGY